MNWNFGYTSIGGEAYEIGIIRFLYEINRRVGDCPDDEKVPKDYLWNTVTECGQQFSANTDLNQQFETFSDFYDFLFEKLPEEKTCGYLTLQDFSDIASDYWISPYNLRTEKCNENSILLSWDCKFCSDIFDGRVKLLLLDSDGNTLNEIALDRLTDYRDGLQVLQSVLDGLKNSLKDTDACVLALCILTNRYVYVSGTDRLGNDSYFTGPYLKVLWSGISANLTTNSLLDILA